ncbi:hypothetical protein RND81_04G084700, partial [Saponaria officinalis]
MNVRVIHRWTRPDIRDKTKTNSIELLLLDVENEIIQATIMRQLISFFGSKILVGKVYSIRNITVVDNLGPDKATPKPCRLKFEFSSKVQEITDTSISVHGYRFAKFEDIISRQSVNYSLHSVMSDVVGKLYEIGPIVETWHEHKCRTIKLEDIEGCQLSCTLWPPHTVQLPALISEQPNPNQSKIIVMQCVETKKFEGIVAQYFLCTPVNIFEERFQVKFIVADTTDEEAAFVVFDSQITQFINHTAAELLAKIEKAFIDKTFVFKIGIHDKYNVCNGSNSYTVLHMSDDVGLCEKWLAKYTELFK